MSESIIGILPRARARSPPPRAFLFCRRTKYNVYCPKYALFGTCAAHMCKQKRQLAHVLFLRAGRAGDQSINVRVIDVNVLMLHDLPSFTRQIPYFVG